MTLTDVVAIRNLFHAPSDLALRKRLAWFHQWLNEIVMLPILAGTYLAATGGMQIPHG